MTSMCLHGLQVPNCGPLLEFPKSPPLFFSANHLLMLSSPGLTLSIVNCVSFEPLDCFALSLVCILPFVWWVLFFFFCSFLCFLSLWRILSVSAESAPGLAGEGDFFTFIRLGNGRLCSPLIDSVVLFPFAQI